MLKTMNFLRNQSVKLRNIRYYSEETPKNLLNPLLKPTPMQKKFLVWTGKFKNESEVPEGVSNGMIQKANSKMRIKVANYGMAISLVICVIVAIMGKKKAERGETLRNMNINWHKEMNEKHKEKEAKNQ